MEKSIHLGDGAYATFTGHDYLISADDHRPEFATGTVTLDAQAMRNLIAFVKAWDQESEASSE